ncbi:MAG TPA: energy-coupling factor ABC transporter permease [Pseudonocardiaceae bacterium]|nr:energy-coupling factor ABC transporter permease [Pseudonocardiaceae bacterium]
MNVALHLSDGIVDAPTSLAYALVAAIGLAVAAAGARADLDERTAPMAGLVAAFVFAAQMVNFPVLPGVSGHLLGGALAAILVGPWVGALCVGIVVVMQAVLFADGGLSALGANITNLALAGTAAGYGVATLLRRLARRGRSGLIAVAFAGALVGSVAAAASFVVQYAIGGDAGVATGSVAIALLGVHVLIGVGEGVITALTVGAVARVRPDLVHLLRAGRRPAAGAAVAR